MKKYFWFLIALFLAIADLTAGSDSDTVWTKNIWPENVSGVMFSHEEASPGGSNIYVSTDKRVWVLNTLTGDSIRTVSNVGSFLAISPDNKFIYTSYMYKLDAQTLLPIARFDTTVSKQYGFSYIALTKDGKKLISVSKHSYNQGPTQDTSYIEGYSTETMKSVSRTKFAGASNKIALSPDEKYIVTSWGIGIWGSKNITEKLLLWDAKTFHFIKEIYSDTIGTGVIKFTPDSKYLAVGFNQVWFYKTDNFALSKKIEGTIAMTFTNDSKYMITGDDGYNTLRMYDIEIGNLKYQFNGLGAYSIDINPERNFIIGGGGYYFALYSTKFVGIEENPLQKKDILIYPNPIDDTANISFNSENSGFFKIEIFNSSGVSVIQINNDFLTPGKHDFIWNTNGNPNGTYYCKITGKETNLIYKIIVNK